MTRFRQATAGDVDDILGMMRGYYEQDGYTFVEAEARAAALALVQDPHLGRRWVTCDGDRVVGYVAVALGFSFEYYERYLMTKWLTASRQAPRGAGDRRAAPRSGRKKSPGRG